MTPMLHARLIPAVLALLVLAGCQGEEQAANAQQPAPPPAEVGVYTAEPEALPVISELPGRISATRIAEVRPRVSGIITERVFEQGSNVEEGQPLFRIDPATFEVQVQAAQASVARAEAVLLQASQEAARTRTLVERRASSQANLDTAVALQRQAEADLASARASLNAAQINLDYATVRAPISGRIGRAIVTEGALVSSSDSLATIQQLDPVYADFQQPVTELIRLREALRNGTLEEIAPDAAGAQLIMDDGTPYPHPGQVLFSEATVDPASGQVTLRGQFPNPEGNLLPGMYVRVAIDEGIEAEAIAVPNQAIQRDTAGRPQLFVVNAQNEAVLRSVETSRVIGNRTVVESGVEAGERVVADGFQKIGPGATVTPVPWTDPAVETPAGQTPAAGDLGETGETGAAAQTAQAAGTGAVAAQAAGPAGEAAGEPESDGPSAGTGEPDAPATGAVPVPTSSPGTAQGAPTDAAER